MPFTGEILALTTVLCWSISVQFFEAASKRVGPISVNIIRIAIALGLFSTLLLVRDGTLYPSNFPLQAWFYLSLSGIVGFFISDLFLFMALVKLGPRLAMLIHSLAAPATAIIGWFFLDESYRISQWMGILIALSGVGLVILERSPAPSARSLQVRTVSIKGLAFGVGAFLGQAIGYIFSKVGMQVETGYLDAFSSTQIRAIAAFFCFSAFLTITNKWGTVKHACRDRRAILYTAAGSAVGPFLGVSLSLLILHYLAAGIAATFLSLVPIFMLPFARFLHKEHVSFRAVIGTCIAVFGIYVLVS